MRIDLYNDAGGNSIWKQIQPAVVNTYTELQVNKITDYTIEGKVIKYGTTYVVNPFVSGDTVFITSPETYSPYKTVFTRNGFGQFNVISESRGGSWYFEIGNFYYYLNSLGGSGLSAGGITAIRVAEIQIDSVACVAFYYWMDAQHTMLYALVISANFFDGSFATRYTPPTTPDDDAGYGTGETPNGEQAGVGTQGGGDHISVYPPNVDVNVEVNMPEPEKVQRAQPSNINIAVIDGTSLNALISALWGKSADGFANLWQQFENYKFNPMAGVVKCMKLPFWVVSGVNKATDPSSIGIAGTTIVGFTGNYISNPIVQKTYSIAMASEDEGIPFTRFNDFKDFVGVSVQAYAPFVGWFDLDPSLCFGGGIDFKYTCDASNGNIAVEIWGTSVGQNDTQKHYQLLASGGGNCAYDIIISGNDNGMGDKVNGFSQIASGVVTTAVGLVTENVPAAAAGALGIAGGAVKATNAQQQTVMVGNISGSAGYLGYLIPFVRVIKPRYVLPDEYENIYGRPVSGGAKVSDFEGCYAELDIKCTDLSFANAQEQQRIISYLENGVIV